MQSLSLTRITSNDQDPLSLAIQPPPNETLEEKMARLAIERRQKEVSDSIDEELEKAHNLEKRNPKAVKILLLGQSESGKSTTLKNFQLMYDPKTFREERMSWRGIIQLNVVQSIRTILDFIERAENQESNSPSSPTSPRRSAPLLSPEILGMKARLHPLITAAEITLIRRLTSTGGLDATEGSSRHTGMISDRKGILKEIAINSNVNWKNAFGRLRRNDSDTWQSFEITDTIDWEDPEDPWVMLQSHIPDMVALWNGPNAIRLLGKHGGRIEDISGYFLDSLERITTPRYLPTDDDILHARLKTLGVSEHLFKISGGHGVREWKVYDVGGHRSQRAAWAPYFDDMDAIIFLAPVSCFDQVLEEDHKVNRLEDSFKLWTMIVSNPLLKHTNIILFLNKIDILRSKLASGVRLKDFVTSYGDRPNDLEHTTLYLKKKFASILSDKSPLPRVFYSHFTTVTDTKSTSYVLTNLQDMLMRQNLTRTKLLG